MLLHTPLAMGVSVAVIGLLIGPLFPVAISRAGRADPGRAASMAAKVSVIGGPRVLMPYRELGLAVEAVSLPAAFTLIIVLAALATGMAALEGSAGFPEQSDR